MRWLLIVLAALGALLVVTVPTVAAAETTPPPPIVVETDPPRPDLSTICAKGDTIQTPADAGPWLYGVHFDEVGDTGAVYAYLPDGYVSTDGTAYWPGNDQGVVWEFIYPSATCPTPEPVQPMPAPSGMETPEVVEPSAESAPSELANTGAAWWLLPLSALGCALILVGALARRLR